MVKLKNIKNQREHAEEAQQESHRSQAEVSALLEGARAVLAYREFKDSARAIFDSCKALIGGTAGYIALLSKDGSNNVVLFLALRRANGQNICNSRRNGYGVRYTF